jgi:hypothetical protein
MPIWRRAILIGILFVTIGVIYGVTQYSTPEAWDFAGVTLLIVLGAAMTFTFGILLRGSREL